MNINKQEFIFLTESITSDIIQLLIDREHYTLPEAVSEVYDSATYRVLLQPTSGFYFQSSGYVFEYLRKELANNKQVQTT